MKNERIKNILKINKNIKSQIILYSVMLFIVLGLMVGYAYSQSCKINTFSNDYKENLIRFHVLANSDSEEDQALKLKVRDKVISYLKPKLEDSESISQSEKIILNEKDKMDMISELYNRKNLKESEFLSKFDKTLKLLDGIEASELTKQQAQKMLREIDSYTVIPRNIYDSIRDTLIEDFYQLNNEFSKAYDEKNYDLIDKLKVEKRDLKKDRKSVV